MSIVLADADLAGVAELMSTHRASLLLALIGGRPLSAGALAFRAGISPSLTSAHLSRLLDGGLVTVEQHGRHRYYQLASAHVAEVLEAMLSLAPDRQATTLREANNGHAIRHARTCYDHFAGALGVGLTDALQRQHIMLPADDSYRLTDSGRARLEALGLDIDGLHGRRRAFARPCLDWTERRSHLAGSLGAGIAQRLIELGWVQRRRDTRALRITTLGQRRLRDEFGLNITPSSQ